MNPQYTAYLSNKVQRITAAVYRVSDLLPDKEPLKWQIREKAVFILSNFISFKTQKDIQKIAYLEQTGVLIEELLVLLSLLFNNEGIYSTTGVNFSVLAEEYRIIKKSLEREIRNYSVVESPNKSTPFLPQLSIGQKSKSNRHNNGRKEKSDPPSLIKTTPKLNEVRKSKILNIIKAKKEVSVGELSSVFTQVSEKTIQRDLLEMVSSGVLKKQGDKRWRKYTLMT
jgi:hypothetical protein